MKKYTIIAFMLTITLIVLLSGCTQQKTAEKETTETGKEQLKIEDTSQASLAPVKEILITAKQFEFVPNIVDVNKGDKIRLKIKSIDVTHGFVLQEFDINEKIEPDKEVIVEFVADKTGEFSFFCSIPCGSGHAGMKGKMIVR